MVQLMKFLVLSFLSVFALTSGLAAEKESRFFEMRIYYAAPGKLDDLQARFRNHTVKLFEKHEMTNIGYWTPVTNTENKLIYLLAYPAVKRARSPGKSLWPTPNGSR